MLVDLSPETKNQTLSVQSNHNIHFGYIVIIGYFLIMKCRYINHHDQRNLLHNEFVQNIKYKGYNKTIYDLLTSLYTGMVVQYKNLQLKSNLELKK